MEAKEHLEGLQRVLSRQGGWIDAFLGKKEWEASKNVQEGLADGETNKI